MADGRFTCTYFILNVIPSSDSQRAGPSFEDTCIFFQSRLYKYMYTALILLTFFNFHSSFFWQCPFCFSLSWLQKNSIYYYFSWALLILELSRKPKNSELRGSKFELADCLPNLAQIIELIEGNQKIPIFELFFSPKTEL